MLAVVELRKMTEARTRKMRELTMKDLPIKQTKSNFDKLFKIRPVLNAFEKTSPSALNPEEFQSIDEQIIYPSRAACFSTSTSPRNPKTGM